MHPNLWLVLLCSFIAVVGGYISKKKVDKGNFCKAGAIAPSFVCICEYK